MWLRAAQPQSTINHLSPRRRHPVARAQLSIDQLTSTTLLKRDRWSNYQSRDESASDDIASPRQGTESRRLLTPRRTHAQPHIYIARRPSLSQAREGKLGWNPEIDAAMPVLFGEKDFHRATTSRGRRHAHLVRFTRCCISQTGANILK